MFFSLRIKTSVIAAIVTAAAVISVVIFMIFRANADEDHREGVFVPIIMYHSILKDESAWNDYVLSPIELEKDIVYLKRNGWTPVFISDLVNYNKGFGDLPEKPVVLTFDDGDYNFMTYVLPLLEKYDFKATVSVVGGFSEYACEEAAPSPAYSYLDWEDIKTLSASGRVEIANHTYDMHSLKERKGSSIKEGESFEDYRRAFFNDTFKTQQLLKDNCGLVPKVYTYPYGFICEESRQLVKECGFDASLGVQEKPNYIVRGDEACLYDMNRYNRPSFITTDEFMKKALSAG